MSSVTDFNAFVVGLDAWLKDRSNSAFFRWGCHRLAFAMSERYPKTQAGLLKLLEEPLKAWYPGKVPKDFDDSCGFLSQGQLSAAAKIYYLGLGPDDLPEGLLERRLQLENNSFYKLFSSLREAYGKSDVTVQKKFQAEYVLLRRFLIEHPYATTSEIKAVFRKCQYAKANKVGDLYKTLSAEAEKSVWICDRCGPLMMEDGQLTGVKPTVCDGHRKGLDWIHEVELKPGSRQLLSGIHLTVLIPGVPEIALFRMLEELCQQAQPGLDEVLLYPEIDRYDLQLRFSDRTVWAIDVKDIPNPLNLAHELKPLNRSGSLKYDEGLYVVPEVYISRNPEYLTQARSLVDMKGIQLMGTDTFEAKVNGKIKQLQRGQKR